MKLQKMRSFKGAFGKCIAILQEDESAHDKTYSKTCLWPASIQSN